MLAGLVFFSGVVLGLDRHARGADPLLEGKRMSAWAVDLVGEHYGRGEYRIKRDYMRIFQTDRDAAIPALMKAVGNHHSHAHILWCRFTQLLPKRLRTAFRPETTYPINRWAGVLALSNFAREKPDPRIPAFFLECMSDSNAAVRKIAAYEAGPWLDPEHPEKAAKILSFALQDRSPDVRRDACRRIIASGRLTNSNYQKAIRELAPQLNKLDLEKSPEASPALAMIQKLD